MQNLTFAQPVPVRIKEDKFPVYKKPLARMGIFDPFFFAVGVTPEGNVIPDPNCLADTREVTANVNCRLCEFEPEVAALIRAHRIPLAS